MWRLPIPSSSGLTNHDVSSSPSWTATVWEDAIGFAVVAVAGLVSVRSGRPRALRRGDRPAAAREAARGQLLPGAAFVLGGPTRRFADEHLERGGQSLLS